MIICWHIEKNKLYFGKVTRRSWHRAIRGKCGYVLEVKPLKKFEKFNYYPDKVMVELQDAHLTNWIADTIPLTLYRCLAKEHYHLDINTMEITPFKESEEEKMEFINGIQIEFEKFLYRAFIDIPAMHDSDINKYHDYIYEMIEEMLKSTHKNYLIEEEGEEEE